MSSSGRSGAHSRAAAATSHTREPGPARSKSISATATPSRKTTLSRFGSLWLTSPVANRGGTGSCHASADPSKDSTASW